MSYVTDTWFQTHHFALSSAQHLLVCAIICYAFICVCLLSVLCAWCIWVTPLCCYVPICLPVYSVMHYTVCACSVNQWLKVTGRAYRVSREGNKWGRGFPSPRLFHPASFTLTVVPRVSKKRQCYWATTTAPQATETWPKTCMCACEIPLPH